MSLHLGDLEWWQSLVAILLALGLSPGPWILGLAAGRIQFSRRADAEADKRVADIKDAHAQEIAELKAYHAAMLAEKDARYVELRASRDYYRTARLEEEARNTKITEQLIGAVEVARLGVHALTAINQAVKDAPDGT